MLSQAPFTFDLLILRNLNLMCLKLQDFAFKAFEFHLLLVRGVKIKVTQELEAHFALLLIKLYALIVQISYRLICLNLFLFLILASIDFSSLCVTLQN